MVACGAYLLPFCYWLLLLLLSLRIVEAISFRGSCPIVLTSDQHLGLRGDPAAAQRSSCTSASLQGPCPLQGAAVI